MRNSFSRAIACWAMVTAATAFAQTAGVVAKGPEPTDPYSKYMPDPTHIPFIRADSIPWQGQVGKEQQYNIFGDPRKPGAYAMLLKWYPGNFSKPHYHPMPRYVTVISGTWWTSSSNVYDPTKTYPLGPGSVVTDVVNTVHWDGAKDEPVVLLITGEGPSPNINVDADGKPLGKVNF
ncbi:MAG: cupin domain-containing protein [Janthinobacterium lividum]